MNKLRDDLPLPLPPRIAALPVDERGYPVPWFVSWVDGKPEFRAADARKLFLAVREKRCWVCGDYLGVYKAFVLGPMCTINRVSAEPPSHRDCAEFSAKACPFLTKPHMRRREDGLPEEAGCAGHMIKRNPGAVAIWMTKTYTLADAGNGVLFKVGDPEEVTWWSGGRTATRAEVMESITTGLPLLKELAEKEGLSAVVELGRMTGEALKFVPAA